MTTIINTTLGENKGRPRLWLEGDRIRRCGIEPGKKFTPKYGDKGLVIHVADFGQLTVSKRKRRNTDTVYPVIDYKCEEMRSLFAGAFRLRCVVRKAKISVKAHHHVSRVDDRVFRLIEKLKSNRPLDVGACFHGGGILDSALHSGLTKMGIKSRLAVAIELEGRYLDSSIRNIPELWDEETIAIKSPAQDVDLSRAMALDIVVMGIPCTGASLSGRAHGLEHAESHKDAGALFYTALRFIEASNPAMVVIENVAPYANTASMEVIRSMLKCWGYAVQERVLGGNEFGDLEDRQRLCVVAVTEGLAGAFDIEAIVPHVVKPNSLSDVLENIHPDDEMWKNYDYLKTKAKKDKESGKNFKLNEVTGIEGFVGCLGKGYAKVRSTEARVLHPLNPEKSRLLIKIEHCAVKGIPARLIAGENDTTAHEILGQSVCYSMFEAVGIWMGKGLLDIAANDEKYWAGFESAPRQVA